MNSARLFFNIFGSILIKLRYLKKADPFKIFHNMILKEKPLNSSIKTKGTYIIAPVRVSPGSNLFEGLIGYFLKLRGYNVKAIMCDQAVTFCDNISKNTKNKNVACALCKKEQERFCNIFDFEKLSIKESLSDSEINKIKKEVENRDFQKKSDFIWDSVNLYDDIFSGTLRYTLKSEIKTKDDLEVLKKSAYTSFIFSTATRKIITNTIPIGVIMSHGFYSTWGAILTVCKQLKTEIVIWGRGYVGQGNILFSRNCSYPDEAIIEDVKIWKNRELSSDEKEITQNYFDQKINRSGKVEHVDYYENLSSSDFNKLTFYDTIKKYKNVYGMFTNITWDGQVFNKTEGFPNTNSYINNTVEWFIKNPDCLLVIRAHPAEKSRETAEGTETFEELLIALYPTLPENVIFLEPENPISSYELARAIDVAILFGSSLSLEFAVANIPVIQTGLYNVNGKGLVFECQTKEEYWKLLETVKYEGLQYTKQMRIDILKYAHYWIFRKHIEDTTVELKSLEFQHYKFKNMSEFRNNKFLNFISDTLINDEKIVNK